MTAATHASPWDYFTVEELKCKCGKCGSTGLEMNHNFMNKIVQLRKQLNFPFTIVSGYRCPRHNQNVSSTGENGPHTTGKAIDISVRTLQAYQLIHAAIQAGFTGIGVNQKGLARFIHLDALQAPEYPRPNLWSY